MPKSFYQNEADIPADQRGAYVQKNGRFELTELDADHPTIAAKAGLEETQRTLKSQVATLTTQAGDLQQKLTIAETRTLPAGTVAVTPEVKAAGDALIAAGVKPAEVEPLKTAATDLQKKLDAFEGEKVIGEIAAVKGWNNRWQIMAKDKGLKFEKVVEKVDGKDVEDYVVLNADGTKPKVEDFNKTDGYFKEFADTFVAAGDKPDGIRYVGQTPGADKTGMTTKDLVAAQLKARYTPRTPEQVKAA